MKDALKRSRLNIGICAALLGSPLTAFGIPIIESENAHLNFTGELWGATFHSDKTYDPSAANKNDSSDWTEAYIKYGFAGDKKMGNGEWFGALNAVSSGTWGDGDASGLTTGDERKTTVEEAYIGYRTDQVEFSFGPQNFAIGDGFIINNDGVSAGKGLDGFAQSQGSGVDYDRGGAYWLAARKAFSNSAILRLGSDKGWRSDVYWLQSDNAIQASMEMAGINIEHNNEYGVVGLLYNQGLSVDKSEADLLGWNKRDGQKTTSLRYQGNAGIDSLFLSGEYAHQTQGDSSTDGNAWYAEAGWTFKNLTWSPSLNYRFTRYEEGYDPLFYGVGRGYGTWLQGEIAANYAFAQTIDSDIQSFRLTVTPTDMISAGAIYVDIDKSSNGTGNNDAQELDLWMEWVVNEHLIVSPLVGFYKPKTAANVQSNTDTNVYAHIFALVPF